MLDLRKWQMLCWHRESAKKQIYRVIYDKRPVVGKYPGGGFFVLRENFYKMMLCAGIFAATLSVKAVTDRKAARKNEK